jgi:hypothetical protein
MDNEVDSMDHDLYVLILNIKSRLIVQFINLGVGEKIGQVQNWSWFQFCGFVTLTSGT